jgi:plasmid stabilization system protein ParE
MRYVFHPEALSEYAEAVQYYTEQRVEVAQAFINAIEDTVYRIRESPPMADQGSPEVMGRQASDRPPKGVMDRL